MLVMFVLIVDVSMDRVKRTDANSSKTNMLSLSRLARGQ